MPKTNKLGKLKCMIKRWHYSSRLARSPGYDSSPESSASTGFALRSSISFNGDEVPSGFHAVYVGKSRRRYLISKELTCHPLFQSLVGHSGGSKDGLGTNVVGCEVVLFEHMLWMLENAERPPESMDELVEFYTC